MIPRSDSDAPSMDPGVLKELRALDPDLTLTFRRHVIDLLTDEKIIVKPGMNPTGPRQPGPILSPCWYLWVRQSPYNDYRIVKEYPLAMGGFNHTSVAALRRDVFRTEKTVAKALQAIADGKEKFTKAAKDRQQARKADEIAANDTKIHETLDGLHKRDARIVSYRGQGSRGTRDGRITPDTREAGWEFHEENHREGGVD